MNITIKDIATLAGVSYSTVSKALNGSPLVKEDTKRKIVEIAKEMGYEPNIAAQRLVSKNTKIIGLIWPTIERTVLATLVTKISDEIANTSYSMVLSVDPIQKAMDTFKKFQVDGIILFEENVNIDINPNSTPLIAYGVSRQRNYQYPIIDANHEQAMYEAVHYLYGLGHRNITYIGDISPIDPFQMEKYEGFKKAMDKFGLAGDEYIIDTRGLDWYNGYVAATKLLELNSLPTAIVGGSYDISGGIIRCLKENNVSIPEDISVISYDNIPQMANMEIPLNCIGVSVEALASEIVHSIINLVETENLETQYKKMTPTLIERSSCAYART
ncbi:LacI family DNA-binding transcriptional regulator [Aquibacillus rhizosphaerae]|uniref:LacI family DNA-binding transcriptional regulator n=1 Tax=Aquibacillus rhizosphaerae TaxID=3051431 RepID=A0ABT7L532_9BACI|nr:LacI family DNA-binding transcriptional regulator [Aquibacillus sp. LR5S19]MDL4840292.1 LacI family DNA-binding transcriptional regulator [Aquibacillus sp. LR5S19]